MSETPVKYQLGELAFITSASQTPEQILANWFAFTETGMSQLDPVEKPPEPILELAGLYLRCKQDELKAWLGDWAVIVARHYGVAGYEKMVAVCGLDVAPGTMEDYAYVCRRVTEPARLSIVSFSHWRCVASLTNPAEQRNLLQYAADNNLSVHKFRKYLKSYFGVESPEEALPSDRTFELSRELYDLEINLQETETARDEAMKRAERAESALAQYTAGLPSPELAGQTISIVQENLRCLADSLSKIELLKNPDKELGRIRAAVLSAANDLAELGR